MEPLTTKHIALRYVSLFISVKFSDHGFQNPIIFISFPIVGFFDVSRTTRSSKRTLPLVSTIAEVLLLSAISFRFFFPFPLTLRLPSSYVSSTVSCVSCVNGGCVVVYGMEAKVLKMFCFMYGNVGNCIGVR